MPELIGEVLVYINPLLNIQLFRKGFYHLKCSFSDKERLIKNVSVRSISNTNVIPAYPEAHVVDNEAVFPAVYIEYEQQHYKFDNYFVFAYRIPLDKRYQSSLQTKLWMNVQLYFSETDTPPVDLASFTLASSRVVTLLVDWRKNFYEFVRVCFDFTYFCAVGVFVNASLTGITTEDSIVVPAVRKWSFGSHEPITLTLSSLLFTSKNIGTMGTGRRASVYQIPLVELDHARQVCEELCELLLSVIDQIDSDVGREAHSLHTQDDSLSDLNVKFSIEGMLTGCKEKLHTVGSVLNKTWTEFCSTAVFRPSHCKHLMVSAHRKQVLFMLSSVVSLSSSKLNLTRDYIREATALRNHLLYHCLIKCEETQESGRSTTVIFEEVHKWNDHQPTSTQQSFLDHSTPYLLPALHNDRVRHPASAVHLVVCVHGLQGSHFDLQLYRAYMELALPNVCFTFLMSTANEQYTFEDFNVMTDRLLEEFLAYVETSFVQPSHISFIGSSLGNVVIRCLLTRPKMSPYLSLLHTFISICGPHLGARHVTSLVGTGMWVLRKWHKSQSLLQLSRKDGSSPRESFLYHLSLCPGFEYFKNVLLVASHQDKYVPFHSARLQPHSGHDQIELEMIQNLIQPMERANVNLIRYNIDHVLTMNSSSLIGRAAHVAMLDSMAFVEKFIIVHCAKYFV